MANPVSDCKAQNAFRALPQVDSMSSPEDGNYGVRGILHVPNSDRTSVLNLKAGETVEVRNEQEILATLDENGRLDGLPFMPEMLPYCGKRLRVSKRADKTCDPVHVPWRMLRLTHTVHLTGLRCDGAAHGGCQAGCLLFWNEAWLKRAPADFTDESALRPASPGSANGRVPATGRPPSLCTIETLVKATRMGDDSAGNETFSCQVTEVRKLAPELPWWDLRQYARDLRYGNVGIVTILRAVLIGMFNWIQRARDGTLYPYLEGKLNQTPADTLDLQPGEWVEVKGKAEILATLNGKANNRGLSFDCEMVKYCGLQFRVLRRVTQIINEKTGKMIKMKGDCIVLDGVSCESDYHYFCPRSIYSYWREIWLRRVGDPRRGPEVPLPRVDKLLDRVFTRMERWEQRRELSCASHGKVCCGTEPDDPR